MRAPALAVAVTCGLAAALSPGTASPQQAATPAVVALAPPLGQGLTVTIRDDRLLADGSRAQFAMREQLRFERGDSGLVASLVRSAVDCTGPDALCTAFRRVLGANIGVAYRFSVTADGVVTAIAPTPGVAVPLPGQRGAMIAPSVAAAGRGTVFVADVAEALAFAGHPITTPRNSAGWVSFTVQEPVGQSGMVRSSDVQVDPVTGLSRRAHAVVRGAGGASAPISAREWTLD